MTPVESIAAAGFLEAFHANLCAFWRDYGALGAALHDDANLWWFATGVSFAGLNRVLLARLDETEVEPALNGLAAHGARLGVPFTWWIGPLTRPDGLAARLEARGIGKVASAPGMACSLAELGETFRPIAGFTIERVAGKARQHLWGRLVGEAYGWPPDIGEAFAELESRLPAVAYETRPRYLGLLDGDPVAAAALVLDAGLAGIYAVGTLPAARGRGIGAAMTLAPLREARAGGYAVAILQSSVPGYYVYRKLGFNDICRFDLHVQPAV